jgi:hypothetical protein
MANFFNSASQSDKDLLHKSVRDHDELELLVDKVEHEIIDAFKQRDMQSLSTYEAFFEYEFGRDPSKDIKVRLSGYDEDDPASSDSGLKEALRRTIADVVSWALRNYDNSHNVRSIQQGQRSVTYATVIPSWRDWPSGWDNMLHNYDARISTYGI